MDIVERLRTVKLLSQRNQYALQEEAAAEITRLRAERGKASTLLMQAWHFVRETELVEGENGTMLWEQAMKLRKEIDDFLALIEGMNDGMATD